MITFLIIYSLGVIFNLLVCVYLNSKGENLDRRIVTFISILSWFSVSVYLIDFIMINLEKPFNYLFRKFIYNV